MWLEAIITHADLIAVLREMLPVKILLQDKKEQTEEEKKERWLWLGPATDVTLVADQGLRVTCPAEIAWEVVGVTPTVKLDELRVMLKPEVVEKHDGNVLAFKIEVEEADFHMLPALVDNAVAKAVNGALAAKPLEWNFTETIGHTVPLDHIFDLVKALKIEAKWGKIRISAEALALAISINLGFSRTD